MFQAQNRETINTCSTWKVTVPSRSLWRRARQDRVSQHNIRPARPRPRPQCARPRPRPRPRPIFCSQTGLVPTVSDNITDLKLKECFQTGLQHDALSIPNYYTLLDQQSNTATEGSMSVDEVTIKAMFATRCCRNKEKQKTSHEMTKLELQHSASFPTVEDFCRSGVGFVRIPVMLGRLIRHSSLPYQSRDEQPIIHNNRIICSSYVSHSTHFEFQYSLLYNWIQNSGLSIVFKPTYTFCQYYY